MLLSSILCSSSILRAYCASFSPSSRGGVCSLRYLFAVSRSPSCHNANWSLASSCQVVVVVVVVLLASCRLLCVVGVRLRESLLL